MASPSATSKSPSPSITPSPADPETPSPAGPPKEDESSYPQGIKLATILVCIFAVVFLVALDRTIIGTAVPKITDEFHSIADIGWYGSAFLLPGCSFTLVFGRLYQLYPIKTVYLICVTIFEIGSAVCGAAPNSGALIAGRTVAGLGSAGLFSGTVIILVHTIPLRKRPIFQAGFGAIFGLSSVIGPLIGGAFTDNVSWRWCFYINLPIGCVVIIALIFLLHIDDKRDESIRKLSFSGQIQRLDPVGTVVFIGGTVSLLLALQWGGVDYSWSSARVIALLVLACVLLIAWVVSQIWRGEQATVPPRIMGQRSVAAAMWFAFCLGSTMLVVVYYLPIWFQAIQSTTAITSGIRMLALILALVISQILGGRITFTTGYYVPQMLLGVAILSTGAGLLTTLNPHTDRAHWIGFQVLFGFGLGLGMMQPNIAVQTVLNKKDVPTGTSLIFFVQFLGGSVALSVAQNVFASRFATYLLGIPDLGVPVDIVLAAGATGLRSVVNPAVLPQVLTAFSNALVKIFYVAVGTGSMGIVGALAMEWRSIKKGEGQADKKGVDEKVEAK